jgi:nucleoside-diphosphate-sugar epimerase
VRVALVTGATGHVGAYVTERLIADGWHVRALVRAPAAATWLERLGASLVPGDVLDAQRFRASAEGCDVIFHAAAVVTAAGGWEIYRAVNVEGSRNAVAAAANARAKLVHVSSVAVYGGSSRYRDGKTDEDLSLAPLAEGAHYARSKRESEALVLQAHVDRRIWATAVRPDVIYGRHDRQFVPRVAGAMARGFWPRFGSGGSTLAVVHGANVADGIVRAAGVDAAGGRAYNLANDFDVTVNEFVRLAAQGLGRPVRMIPVPVPLARAAFRATGLVMRLVKGPSMSRETLNTLAFLTRDNPFTSERARRELGWSPPVRPEEGIPEAFRWWREQRRRPRP